MGQRALHRASAGLAGSAGRAAVHGASDMPAVPRASL